MTSSDDDLGPLVQEIYNNVGKCVLKLQSCELLLKDLIARSQLEATERVTVQESLRKRQDNISNATLGLAIKQCQDSILVTLPNEDPLSPQDGERASPDLFSIRLQFSIDLAPENKARVIEQQRSLLEQRNQLVHRFLLDHNLQTKHGCQQAISCLDNIHAKADQHLKEIQTWAESYDRGLKELATQLLNNEELRNAVIGPDWTPIITGLKAAEAALSQDGWISLDVAMKYMGQHFKDHFPKRYNCKTWKEVLTRAQVFETRENKAANEQQARLSYRSK